MSALSSFYRDSYGELYGNGGVPSFGGSKMFKVIFPETPWSSKLSAEVWSVGYGFFWGPVIPSYLQKQGVQGSLETELSPKKLFFSR